LRILGSSTPGGFFTPRIKRSLNDLRTPNDKGKEAPVQIDMQTSDHRSRFPLKTLLLWVLPLSFLTLFYFYPLGSILTLSFYRLGDALLPGLWSVLSSPSTRNVVGFTFYQAVVSTLLTLLLGLPAAYLFGRYSFPGKRFYGHSPGSLL
jgi:ABC-type sugar transport system permease subunit